MKKIILLIISLILLASLLIACSAQNVSNPTTTGGDKNSSSKISTDLRQIAFEQLPSVSKGRIKGTWQDAKLSIITLREDMGIINDKSYIGKEVYIVDFPTESKSKPNNMIFYMSMDNHKLIGTGYVD